MKGNANSESHRRMGWSLCIKNVDVEKQLAFIDLGNDRIYSFNFTQAKPYLTPAQESQAHFENIGIVDCRFGSQNGVSASFFSTYVTEVLNPADPHCECPAMNDAVKEEVKSLMDR